MVESDRPRRLKPDEDALLSSAEVLLHREY